MSAVLSRLCRCWQQRLDRYDSVAGGDDNHHRRLRRRQPRHRSGTHRGGIADGRGHRCVRVGHSQRRRTTRQEKRPARWRHAPKCHLTCTNTVQRRRGTARRGQIANVEYPPFEMWSLDFRRVSGEQSRRSGAPIANSQTSHPGHLVEFVTGVDHDVAASRDAMNAAHHGHRSGPETCTRPVAEFAALCRTYTKAQRESGRLTASGCWTSHVWWRGRWPRG